MENTSNTLAVKLFGGSVSYMRKCLFRALSLGPVPDHLAFILDGNRRYARKWNLGEGMGHRAGFLSLMTLMKYCYELGVKYVTIYAFSIDNFRRKPGEVQSVMDLMQEKIEGLLKEESVVNQYGVRVFFIGNLKLLSETVRLAAEKAMNATANNKKAILLICVAYTSTDEIAHAAQESCEEKWAQIKSSIKVSEAQNGEIINEEKQKGEAQNGEIIHEEKQKGKAQSGEIINGEKQKTEAPNGKINEEKQKDGSEIIKLADIEKHMYMAVAPDPDILVRTSGETRLSNFLLWQTSNSLLYNPNALWPEIGLRHLVWAVLNFQRIHPYLERRRKQV